MLIRKISHWWNYFSSLQNCIAWEYSGLRFNNGIWFCSHMILYIIVNKPKRYKYMGNGEETGPVRLKDHVLPRGPVPQEVIPESLQGPHPARGQHGFPGAQLLVLQPSPPQLPQLLQPQLLIRRVPRHFARKLALETENARPNPGLVTHARSRSADRP